MPPCGCLLLSLTLSFRPSFSVLHSLIHPPFIRHLCIIHQSFIHHSSIIHSSVIYHSFISLPSFIHHSSIIHPSVIHQSSIIHPSSLHHSSISHPSVIHQSSIIHSSLTLSFPPSYFSFLSPLNVLLRLVCLDVATKTAVMASLLLLCQ